jgi:ribosome biogenesis GTPase A
VTGDAAPASGSPTTGRPLSPAAIADTAIADTGIAAPDDALWLLASRLASCAACGEDLTEQARRLTERIAGARFHVAVVGEFKRGKSTLVNALLGRPVPRNEKK